MNKLREGVLLMQEAFPMSDEEVIDRINEVIESLRDDPEMVEAVYALIEITSELESKTATKH